MPLTRFVKELIHLWRRVFQFLWHSGLKSHISDCSTILQSTCIQAGWWILHWEKKSSTSIGNYQRILYCKILHCKPRGISMPLLTHVPSFLSGFAWQMNTSKRQNNTGRLLDEYSLGRFSCVHRTNHCFEVSLHWAAEETCSSQFYLPALPPSTDY